MKKLFYIYRLIFARPFFAKFHYFLYRVGLSGMGVLNYENDRVSGEENFIKYYIHKLSTGVIFDVGANIGNYTKKIRKYNTNVKIHCFEPHPRNYGQLEINTKDADIVLCNVAVGSKHDSLRLFDYAQGDGSSHASLYKEVIEKIHNKNSVSHNVSVIKLDDYVIEKNIGFINLLKIDTEGNELEVLRGFKNHLDGKKVEIIHFEFNEMNVVSRVFFKDFWELLAHYNIFRMLPSGLLPIEKYAPVSCEIFAYQNIVAILKR